MGACICQGGHCPHHAASEPCPNPAVESVSLTTLETGVPIAASEPALCRECWENQAADYLEQ